MKNAGVIGMENKTVENGTEKTRKEIWNERMNKWLKEITEEILENWNKNGGDKNE
jgi:hypothetical protein